MIRLVFVLSFVLIAGHSPAASTYALLVNGNAQEPYARWTSDWLNRFSSFLKNKAEVPPAQITLLSGDTATSEAIRKSLVDLSARIQPDDQFLLVLCGHGENAGQPTFAVKGPDLPASQLADALKTIQAQSQIILNFSATSGDFLKSLASPHRINITATSPTEIKQPVFAEFFLRGLESGRGGHTVLQAFNWAAEQTPLWIARWTLTESGKWHANGRETVGIFQKLYAGVPDRQLDPASDAKADDATVELHPPNGEITQAWSKRRVIDEHALLEDCGQEVGVSILGEAGFQPILGSRENDPGYLAGKTVIGKP